MTFMLWLAAVLACGLCVAAIERRRGADWSIACLAGLVTVFALAEGTLMYMKVVLGI